MKKAYLFALALLVSCAQIEAQEYAVEELLETASYYLNVVFAKHEVAPYSLNSVVQEKEIESISTISRDSVNYMYVFNTIDSTGWIILANEQQYESNVIGYSESGYFDVNGEMPPALLDLLEQHIHTIILLENIQHMPLYNSILQLFLLSNRLLKCFRDIGGINHIIMIHPGHTIAAKCTINLVRLVGQIRTKLVVSTGLGADLLQWHN